MIDFQTFIDVNGLKKKDIASFLGVSNAFITQLCDGRKPLPPAKLALIKANEQGWDVSMLQEDQPAGNINSVVNSKNFSYEADTVNSELIGIIKEQQSQMKESQRQMGILIDTIHQLSTK